VIELILSLFPGIGLLDDAFESEGFNIVRGPDILWGGDIRRFHCPPGVFAGVIGGPPCQANVRYAALNHSIGNKVAEDLIPEFCRVVSEAAPKWFLMENSPLAATVTVPDYTVQSVLLTSALWGLEQDRKRKFQYGYRAGERLKIEVPAMSVPETLEKTCLASEGRSGVIANKRINGKQKSFYRPRRSWSRFCELQGLPAGFLADAPFRQDAKYKVVGNGVPIPMGRALAVAVKQANQPIRCDAIDRQSLEVAP
jgi:DNA (cytosine-5)-methyltransferase 1